MSNLFIKRFVLLFLFSFYGFFALLSCSFSSDSNLESSAFQTTYFDAIEGIPPQVTGQFTQKNELQLENKEIKKTEKISLKTQKILDYEIEGSYLKQISNHRNKKRYQASSVIDENPELLQQIQVLDDKSEIIKKMFHSLGKRQYSTEFSKKIITVEGKLLPVLSFIWVDKNENYIESSRDESFREVRSVRLGSAFASEHSAFVYPESPLRTQIEEIKVGFLQEQAALENSLLALTTDSSEVATPENFTFKFRPEDDSFDQIQTFYFVNRVLNWFQTSFQLGFGQKLEVQTQVGYPEKTNTMFYYSGRIRLGSGDGKSFANVMKDPSIVMHETSHFLIDQVAGLPFQGEGGSLNEGFADALTAIHLKSPYMGEASYLKQPYKRSLANDLRLQDRTGKLYADSLIVSGTFWKMYQVYGEDITKQVLFFVLQRLHPGSDFEHLKELLKQAIVILGPGRSSYHEILKEKGWLEDEENISK